MRSRQSVMSLNGEPLLTSGPVLGDVAKEYGVDVAALTNGRRFPELVEARQECARRLFRDGLSCVDIGLILNRHPMTIGYYLRGKA